MERDRETERAPQKEHREIDREKEDQRETTKQAKQGKEAKQARQCQTSTIERIVIENTKPDQ